MAQMSSDSWFLFLGSQFSILNSELERPNRTPDALDDPVDLILAGHKRRRQTDCFADHARPQAALEHLGAHARPDIRGRRAGLPGGFVLHQLDRRHHAQAAHIAHARQIRQRCGIENAWGYASLMAGQVQEVANMVSAPALVAWLVDTGFYLVK